MGKIEISQNVLQSAISDNAEGLYQLFQPFIGSEKIIKANYFGKLGISIFGTHSFACITENKVISLQIGPFGQIVYQDGDIEHVNSGVIYQPRILMLYLISLVLCLTIVGIILIPAYVRLYYTLNKSGLVWSVREGIPVYLFANRNRINIVSKYWQAVSNLKRSREAYIKAMAHAH